jgi:hypothetical protein
MNQSRNKFRRERDESHDAADVVVMRVGDKTDKKMVGQWQRAIGAN